MSKHPIRGLGTDCGINQPPHPPKYQAVTAMCARPTVTFVDLEEIRAFTPSHGMVYEGLSIIRQGMVGNRREHHNPLFKAYMRSLYWSTLCLICVWTINYS